MNSQDISLQRCRCSPSGEGRLRPPWPGNKPPVSGNCASGKNWLKKFLSDARSGTPYTNAQDDSLDSGGSLGAGDDASWTVFRAPPGLDSSADYHQISKEEWDGLPSWMRSQMYYKGRARRQRNRRYMFKYRERSAQAGQDAPYQ